jgi:hypothetical protein
MAKKKSKYLHVVRRDGEWIVTGDKEWGRAISRHETQAKAIEAAREVAKPQGSTVVIHRSNGLVRKWEHYNLEPPPPKRPPNIVFPTAPTTISKERIRKAVREVMREIRQNESRREARG